MTEPSQSSREIAEEIRQSAKDFGFRQWVKDCDFAIHLAECLDVSYNMGRAYERGAAILDAAALRQRADEATRAAYEECAKISEGYEQGEGLFGHGRCAKISRRHPRPYHAMSSVIIAAGIALLLVSLAARNTDAPAFIPWISSWLGSLLVIAGTGRCFF